jgi:hypothetical protein
MVLRFIRSLLEAPRVHAAVRDAVAERADADRGHLVGIDHEDGAGVVEYVMLPTTDNGYTFTRVLEEGTNLKFASVPNAAELSTAVIDAWHRAVADQPVD